MQVRDLPTFPRFRLAALSAHIIAFARRAAQLAWRGPLALASTVRVASIAVGRTAWDFAWRRPLAFASAARATVAAAQGTAIQAVRRPLGLGAIALAAAAVALSYVSLRSGPSDLAIRRVDAAIPTLLPTPAATPTQSQLLLARQRYQVALEAMSGDYARLLQGLPPGGAPGANVDRSPDGPLARWQAAQRQFLQGRGDDLLKAGGDLGALHIRLPEVEQRTIIQANSRLMTATSELIDVTNRWAMGNATATELARAKLTADEAYRSAQQVVSGIYLPTAASPAASPVAGSSAIRSATVPSFSFSVTAVPSARPATTGPNEGQAAHTEAAQVPLSASAPPIPRADTAPAVKLRASLGCSAGGPAVTGGKRGSAALGGVATCVARLASSERAQAGAAGGLMLESRLGMVGPVQPDANGVASFKVLLNQPGPTVFRLLAAGGTPLDSNQVAFEVNPR